MMRWSCAARMAASGSVRRALAKLRPCRAMQSVGGCHALLPPLVSASVSDFTNAVGTAFNMVWPAPTDALVPSGGTTAIAGSTATGRRAPPGLAPL